MFILSRLFYFSVIPAKIREREKIVRILETDADLNAHKPKSFTYLALVEHLFISIGAKIK